LSLKVISSVSQLWVRNVIGHCQVNRPPAASRRVERVRQAGGAGGGLRDAFAHTDAGKALSFSAAGPTVAPAEYANERFAVAQDAQDSNRGVETAGNLGNVG
jgi:hypothetical protein